MDLKKSKKSNLACAFNVDDACSVYDSIGVASNPDFAAACHREHNAFEGRTSHFEIKFRRESTDSVPAEFLYLNIHLSNDTKNTFGETEVCERLKQGIRLFYSELGVLNTTTAYSLQTNLRASLNVTLDNYEAHGFSCQHPTSLLVLNQYNEARQYRASERELLLKNFLGSTFFGSVKSSTVAAQPLKKQPELLTTFFNEVDFPPLGASSPFLFLK